MPAKKPKKEKPKKKWKPFTPEVYQKEISQLAHFSAKTVNSNTPAFGVRIGVDDRIDIPYVAVSAMDQAKTRIPVDYQKGAQRAPIIAQMLAVAAEDLQGYKEKPPASEVKTIRKTQQILNERYETPSSKVGVRLRQIIAQGENGENVALTPLHSSGFSKELERRLTEEKDLDKPRLRGFLGIGGSRPLNVGFHAESMQRQLWFNAPKEDKEIRRAFAIHFQGISLAIPQKILAEFDKWRRKLKDENFGKVPSDHKTKKRRNKYLGQMVEAVKKRATNATELLVEHRDKLTDGEMTSKSMDPLMRGLLEPDKRYRGWKREFAKKLHITIIDSKIQIDGKKVGLGEGQNITSSWISIIEEAL